MKNLCVCILCCIALQVKGQELYVFAEPASNMPAHSLGVKITDRFVTGGGTYDSFSQRLIPQLQFGISKKFMLHVGATFSNMHTTDFRYESVNAYAKYRFLSKDGIHRHFRMAVFAEASATEALFHFDEISLWGDKSGIGAGLIVTQLWNKLALSGTVLHTQVLDKSRNDKLVYLPARSYQAIDYSISAGYLLLPREYTDYRQLNINLYAELLGESNLDKPVHFVDLAPALQLIFNSNTKLNIGYRFQLEGNMQRMSANSWQLSFERTFLNALKKR